MAWRGRLRALAILASLVVVVSGNGQARSDAVLWDEARFRTGCEPGPFHDPPPPEHHQRPYPSLSDAAVEARLSVNLGAGAFNRPPMLGSGFNLEHALWSCEQFRDLFRTHILDPFKPSIARVDTGLLPAAPPDLPAGALGPAVYESVLSSAPYADSWRFFHGLNQADIKVVLGIWGGPAQFTLDGTRLGVLDPRHYDDYVDYVATVVGFIVRQQGIDVWATTIANEPDGGDGNQIPPDGLAYIAHQLAPRLAPLGVKLYGPDTASAHDALVYVPALLDDPVIADSMAFIGFHQYEPSGDVGALVAYVNERRPDLPLIVTEYTSFSFGDLDDGQEANAQHGFVLDVATMLLSYYRQGVDAALYWDAVDYLQPGHDAITRWGLLRGPGEDFAPRQRYFGLQQILPYLQPGAKVLDDQQDGTETLRSLSIRTATGVPAIFLINNGFQPIELTLNLWTSQAGRESEAEVESYASFTVSMTDRRRRAERLGRVSLENGTGHLLLGARSISTLFPAGPGPQPEEAM